jgi:hypothetical protein
MYKYTSRTWTQEVMGTEGLAGAGSRGRSGERSGGGGWSEGERAGVDKFVFVLSTHESAHGEALYGVCIYWDEPCYLVLPDAEEANTFFPQKNLFLFTCILPLFLFTVMPATSCCRDLPIVSLCIMASPWNYHAFFLKFFLMPKKRQGFSL